MADAALIGFSPAAASHADRRPSSQPPQAVTRGPLGDYAEGSSPAVADGRMRVRQGSHRRSVQFAETPSLLGRKDVSAKRQREGDAATPPPVHETATLARSHLPTDQKDRLGVASAPGMSAQKASGSKLQAKKKSKPSFVEGF